MIAVGGDSSEKRLDLMVPRRIWSTRGQQWRFRREPTRIDPKMGIFLWGDIFLFWWFPDLILEPADTFQRGKVQIRVVSQLTNFPYFFFLCWFFCGCALYNTFIRFLSSTIWMCACVTVNVTNYCVTNILFYFCHVQMKNRYFTA